MLMKKRIIALLTCLALIISVVCIMPDSDAGVATLNITNQKITLSAGQSTQIKLNGIKASSVKWSSSNSSVVKVTKKGTVTGIKAGKAVVTGKYKQLNFKITVTVNKASKKQFTNGDTVLKYLGTGYKKKYDEKMWCISFTFTNNSPTPTSFSRTYYRTVFINGIEVNESTYENAYVDIKDGATVDVDLYYDVKKGDKVDFQLFYGYDKEMINQTFIIQ